jgi:Plasma-membrane choline transporter
MGNPIVVQGTPVTQQQAFGSALETTSPAVAYASGGSSGGGIPQEKKESGCNDILFAILFYVAAIAIIAVAALTGPDALKSASTSSQSGSSSSGGYDYKGYVIASAIIVGISFIGAGLGMAVLMCIPQFLIKTALIFVVIMAGVMAVVSFLGGSIVGGVIGLIFFAFSLCYARAVWSRIPFATANLITACKAIQANLGITIYAYFFAILAGVWSVVWAVACVGVFDSTYGCQAANNGANANNANSTAQVCGSPNYGLLFLLLLAFYFVQQVLQVRCICVWMYFINALA